MKKYIKYLIVTVLFVTSFAFYGYSQSLKLGAHLGYGMPSGNAFSVDGKKSSSAGMVFTAEALYYPEILESKLGLGIEYNGSILFGQSDGSGLAGVGIYFVGLYGVKAVYEILTSKVTPYVALSAGVSHLTAPEIKDGSGTVLLKGAKEFSFGLRPEIGVDIGGFIISASYLVPMKYKVLDRTAGSFQVSLGARFKVF